MPSFNDPEFVHAMEQLFATRGDIKALVDYQQRLFNSLNELTASHRAIHEHVRNLTESHNRGQDNTAALIRARQDLENLLRNLEQAHNQTREEIHNAVNTLNYMQQEIRKIPQLENRLERLERDLRTLMQNGRRDERKDDMQDQGLHRLESNQ